MQIPIEKNIEVHPTVASDGVSATNEVQPAGINNFADRLRAIAGLKLKRAELSGALDAKQLKEVRRFFELELEGLEIKLRDCKDQPVLVLTDLHPMNFLVDDEGKPSGYFDLEFCQAGVPSLEFYAIKCCLFNHFDRGTFQKAEAAFFEGFERGGGRYDRESPINAALETTLSIGYLLAAVTSYHGASDGLRDAWSEQFRDIMFGAIQRSEVDYLAIADVLRTKTQQPQHPAIRGNPLIGRNPPA